MGLISAVCLHGISAPCHGFGGPIDASGWDWFCCDVVVEA